MSKAGRWAMFMGIGALTSACELDLEGRACGLPAGGEEGECMEGWSCCPENNTCQRDCSDGPESGSMTPGMQTSGQNPTSEPPFSSLDLLLGETPYSYSCDLGSGTISEVGDNGGMGPMIDTASSACPWPSDNPRLSLYVKLRDFLPSEGPTVGTWDLSDPETIFPLRLVFVAAREGETLAGNEAPYQYYDSTASIEGVAPPPSVIRAGFHQSPVATGTIEVSLLSSVPSEEYSPDDIDSDGMTDIYLVELSNVILGASDEAEPDPTDPFPPTVTITSAAVTYGF